MIKRNGVEVMNARSKNVGVAKETLAILKDKKYLTANGNTVDITQSLDNAVKNTVYYPAESVFLIDSIYRFTQVEVTNETTTQAAVRWAAEGKTKVVALNFASARNQGGGFLSGAVAQEEDLCRASGLYVCIKTKPMFYNTNILCDDQLYTDGGIYSPDVPFIRDEHGMMLEDPFLLSIISSPSPNARNMEVAQVGQLAETLERRAKRILEIAHSHDHKNIILGAWGCGAFGNDPKMVAEAFQKALKDIPVFDNVCFAVYDRNQPPTKYEIFKEVFK